MTSTADLLTIAEVARICRVHEATVRRHIASGLLRSVRVGRGIRVRTGELQRYMERTTLSDEKGEYRPLTADDPLWELVGAFDGGEGWESGDKYRALHGSDDGE